MKQSTSYLTLVTNYANNILDSRPTTCSNPSISIFPDGIERCNHSPMTWSLPNGEQCPLSNLANQQNLLRTLHSLSSLTNDSKYYIAAKETITYYFTHLQHTTGLLHWGGHRFLDLNTLKPTSIEGKAGIIHELKNCFPFYDFFFEVNPEKTTRLIHGIWNAHVYDFKTLTINRHGYFMARPSKLWASPYEPLPPFSPSKGLSFISIGSDLIYAAGNLFLLTHEKGALIWLKRLFKQYVKAQNAVTGLGAYLYTQALKLEDPPNDSTTRSKYGDRAFRQLGPELGDYALEGHVLLEQQATCIYYHHAIMSLKLGKKLGALGQFLITDTVNALKAYAKYAYNANDNTFKPLLTDGTDLTGFKLMRSGYYGEAGKVLNAFPAHEAFLYAYIEAFSLIQDESLWLIIRQIAFNLDLGDLGTRLGIGVAPNLSTNNSNEQALFATIRLAQISDCTAYKKLALVIAENLINTHYIQGYFTHSAQSKYADFDSPKALALLTLHGLITNQLELVPEYMTGKGYIHGDYLMPSGIIKPYTSKQLLEETIS